MNPPKMVAADTPDRGRMCYLVDDNLDFISEVKLFLDWKAATKRAPATIKAYCSRLLWFYRFLAKLGLQAEEVTSTHLTEFVIWLQHPGRSYPHQEPLTGAQPLAASSINLIVQQVTDLYRFLVRRGLITQSPVAYLATSRGKWAIEADLLAHTRRSFRTQQLELRMEEPTRRPLTISEQEFQTFVHTICDARSPQADPAGFRDRLICLLLKEGGFRLGELLGMRLGDLDFGKQGIHVRFRADNENAARAKAGYGRDRFVHVPASLLGLIDLYVTEVWIDVSPRTDHLWVVLNPHARNREGQQTCGTALSAAAVESMFQHYSKRSGIPLHPHQLRHTHATELVRSYLRAGQPVDWKFIQERLGHGSVVTTMQTYVHLESEDLQLAYRTFIERRDATYACTQEEKADFTALDTRPTHTAGRARAAGISGA
jgi:integrase/recombinase XerD